MNEDFERRFRELTGLAPLSWQGRLFTCFEKGCIPTVIDLPTGMGKTMVMAVWLIARDRYPDRVPTRLVYVVDRRTVVDQATKVAEELRSHYSNGTLAISTLRGQLADNREWSQDPSRPAIIISTVDLVGSSLLFSGYRSSYKRRPLEAGLIGQDALLILDEAHLSKPFDKLLGSIATFQQSHGTPARVMRMSATRGDSAISVPCFGLQVDRNGNLQDEDAKDPIIRERFGARKRLRITTVRKKNDLNSALADAATELARNAGFIGKRIAVFVRAPDDAKDIAVKIRNRQKPTRAKPDPDSNGTFDDSIEILTGTMRGLERDELVQKAVFRQRWLNGELEPDAPGNQRPVFLVSTSAGEVGFDLNADHMVCDAAPLDSLIQRWGRVNRRGKGDATIHVVQEEEPAERTEFDRARSAASKLLLDGMDVSPKALADLKQRLTPQTLKAACSPDPAMVDLTDILLDAWSMTSIIEEMAGRPPVGQWLRGINDDLPQTTIAWRGELDVAGFADLDMETIDEWFDTHRVLKHEVLSVPSDHAAEWLRERWKTIDDAAKTDLAMRPVIVDRGGRRMVTVEKLVEQLNRKNTDLLRHADLTLPDSFGGIERQFGLLDPDAPRNAVETREGDDEARTNEAVLRSSPDVADVAPGIPRLRVVVATDEDGNPVRRPIGLGREPEKAARFRIDLESTDERAVHLVSCVPLREKPEYGSDRETLSKHVHAVRAAVDAMIVRLDEVNPSLLTQDCKRAARLAAQYHDHGKNRDWWQRLVNGSATIGSADWRSETIGKPGDGQIKRDPRGYRHEFGSLRDFTDAMESEVSGDVFDLAMHLIASHHGRGRPHFPKGGFDPNDESRTNDIHTGAIRRFARLQRRYGWWHLAWLENLLRCGDAIASADRESDPEQEDPENPRRGGS